MLPYLVFLKKAQYWTCLDIRDMSYSCMLLSWSSTGFPRSASKRLLTFHSGKKRKCRSSKPCKHCALSFKWNAYSSNYTYARYVVALQILSAAFMYVLLPQVKTILAMARSANGVQRETQARLHENDHFVQNVNWPTRVRSRWPAYFQELFRGLIVAFFSAIQVQKYLLHDFAEKLEVAISFS